MLYIAIIENSELTNINSSNRIPFIIKFGRNTLNEKFVNIYVLITYMH